VAAELVAAGIAALAFAVGLAVGELALVGLPSSISRRPSPEYWSSLNSPR
jgi:hypothetical protein